MPANVKEGEADGEGGVGEDLRHSHLGNTRYGRVASWIWDLVAAEIEKVLPARKVHERPRMK